MTGIAPTADYIAHYAALRPNDLAVIDEGRNITFAQFHADVRRFGHFLKNAGVKPGQTAAIEWTSLYEHWLLVLALEALGVATFSYTKQEVPAYWPFLKTVDLIACSKEAIPKDCGPVLLLAEDQLAKIFALVLEAEESHRLLAPETPVRIQCTSGTTGAAKRMVRIARVNEFRVQQYQNKEGYTRHSRYFLTHPFSVQAIYGRATACIRMGGTCISAAGDPFQTISDYGVTHLSVLPTVLAKMVAARPALFAKPESLTVSTFGARVPDGLRGRLLQGIATELIESYGTNEVGSICTIGPDGAGVVVPGVTVEIVDENDNSLIGQAGQVRVKSPGAVSGYADDPDATTRMFRNGWFYPDDRGIMPDARRLTLLGRTDDLVNIGGIKIDCQVLEEQLRRTVPAQDLCVTTLAKPDGTDQLCVAFVLDPAAKLEEMKAQIAPVLPPNLGEIRLLMLDKIPRTEAGKVQRDALHGLIETRHAGA